MLDAMLPYQVNYYGNPHSRTHAYGWESETAVETARKVSRFRLSGTGPEGSCFLSAGGFTFFRSEQQVADLIGADPREIIFTSGATESNNMAIKVTLLERDSSSCPRMNTPTWLFTFRAIESTCSFPHSY